jgi:ribonuclease BN (tRNA processing enzyme)
MRVTVLGSGSSVPDPERGQSAFAVETGSRSILIDAGENCTRALKAAGVAWAGVDAVFITHFHNDHLAGLIPLLFATTIYGNRSKPMTLYGPAGLEHYVNTIAQVEGEWLQNPTFEITIKEIDCGDVVAIDRGVTVKAFEVDHKEVSLGYRVSAGGNTVSFSGDTKYCANLVLLAKNADAFFCEKGVADDSDHPNHIHWSEIGKAAAKADAKKLVLTHFGESIDEAAMLAAIQKEFNGKIVVGKDRLAIELP